MKALVIGYGSIGERHARILAELGCSVAVVSSREEAPQGCFRELAPALARFSPDYAVVATETSRHAEAVEALAASGFGGRVLVEKPLFHQVRGVPAHRFSGAYVAYNLRFHPVLQRLKEILAGERVLSVQAYVGQYLPTWRPGRDYRAGYSANAAAGGGVLRDLSHELDYLGMLLGEWHALAALGGHFSPLEITSDDVFALLYRTARCPAVTLQLNYLDRVPRRQLLINTADKTVEADLVEGRVSIDGLVEQYQVERDLTYREMHRAVLGGAGGELCSFESGLAVVRMIAAAEKAAGEGMWVTR